MEFTQGLTADVNPFGELWKNVLKQNDRLASSKGPGDCRMRGRSFHNCGETRGFKGGSMCASVNWWHNDLKKEIVKQRGVFQHFCCEKSKGNKEKYTLSLENVFE